MMSNEDWRNLVSLSEEMVLYGRDDRRDRTILWADNEIEQLKAELDRRDKLFTEWVRNGQQKTRHVRQQEYEAAAVVFDAMNEILERMKKKAGE